MKGLNNFKYFGDEWLHVHDIFEKSRMTVFEAIQFIPYGVNFVEPNVLVYYTGQKQKLAQEIAFITGVNRVIRSDPDKYLKILREDDRRVKINLVNFGNGQEGVDKKHNMFQ